MRKTIPITVLAAASIAAWLAASSLATWLNYIYDGALGINTVYLWVWGAVMLLLPLLAVEYIEREPPNRSPRWAGALLLLLFTAIAYLALAYGGWYLCYQLETWWLCLLALVGIAVWLYHLLPCRRPMRPRQPRSKIQGIFILLLVFYVPMLVVLPVYLLVLHPVSVEEITPIGEAEGGRFVGRLTGDRSETPLGIYFFADGDHWYYYDVLTGQPIPYGD